MSASNIVGDVFASAGPRRFPSAEDMRMVRAIALLALLEAVRHGEYRATFRGFRVEVGRRDVRRHGVLTAAIHLVVTFDGTVIERCELDVDEMRTSSRTNEFDLACGVHGETFVGCNGH
ncbi:MAG: hypothetical protein AB7N65_29390 [Vicinamibacterales bacterium]